MTRLAGKLLGLLPIALFVISFNWYQDPANLFRDQLSEVIAIAMLNDENLKISTPNYDERLVQKFYIENLIVPNDVLVIGSSRSMQIGGELYPEQRFQNHSVSGATIEDLGAIFALYHQQNMLPEVLIIGLDPWMLNRNHGQTRWQTLRSEYNHFLSLIGTESNTLISINFNQFDKYYQLLTPTYFQASLAHFFEQEISSLRLSVAQVTDQTPSENTIRLLDGTISYPYSYVNKSVDEVHDIAVRYTNSTPIYSLGNFEQLDSGVMTQLEGLIELAQAENIEVILFVSPYHPYAYEYLAESTDYQLVLEAEIYYQQLAERFQIQIIGASNPTIANCEEFEFYDAMHARPSCIDTIFQSFFNSGLN